MSQFPEWGEVARDPLILPIQGVEYTIPPLGYLHEIRMKESQRAAQRRAQRSTEDTTDEADDGAKDVPLLTDEEFLKMLLGDALIKMRENNVPVIAITHAAAVAHADATVGRETALYVWEKGLDPKALQADLTKVREAVEAQNRAGRRAAAKAAKKAPTKATR